MAGDKVPDYLRGVSQADYNDQHPKRKVTPPPAASRELGIGPGGSITYGSGKKEEGSSKVVGALLNLFLAGGTLALLGFIVVGGVLAVGAYQVSAAELAVKTEGAALVNVVEGAGDAADALSNRGACTDCSDIYAEFSSTEGHDRFHAAYRFATSVEAGVVQAGMMSGPVADQAASMRPPAEQYAAAHARWESQASGIAGSLTCLTGLVNCPSFSL